MPVRTVGEYLKRWGYTAKRPSRHADDQDPEEVREWLEQAYPDIERRASEEDASIRWCDETGVEADHYPRLGYAPKGERATLEVPDSHLRRNVISTVSNAGELHFMTYTGTLDAALFLLFLEGLLADTTGKLFVITDRLSAHDCAKVWDWIDRHGDRIDLFFLPP